MSKLPSTHTDEIPHSQKWCKHTLEPVAEGKNVMILWDFAVHKDKKID